MNKDNLEYKEAIRLLEEKMRHGNLHMGSHIDDVDVELWLPEMNAVNTTIFCDRLIQKYGDGLMFIYTERECISRMNIEYQSSGFKLLDTIDYETRSQMLVLRSGPQFVKKHVFIPKDPWTGFFWGLEGKHLEPLKPVSDPDMEDPNFNKVATARYGQEFILNFSCSGEFGLEIYFKPDGEEKPFMIFGKSYYCK